MGEELVLEKDVNADCLSEYVRKTNEPKVAICTWCKELLHFHSYEKTFKTSRYSK